MEKDSMKRTACKKCPLHQTYSVRYIACKESGLNKWILDGKYLTHCIINEQIREVFLYLIRRAPIYVITVEEARDVSGVELLMSADVYRMKT